MPLAYQRSNLHSSTEREVGPKVQAYLKKFDVGKDSLKFNVAGLLNTKRDNSFYKVIAYVHGVKVCEFSAPDWNECTPSQWRFAACEDTVLKRELSEGSAIVYNVLKYSPSTRSVTEYGYAV